jgi:hypothetical protein
VVERKRNEIQKQIFSNETNRKKKKRKTNSSLSPLSASPLSSFHSLLPSKPALCGEFSGLL